jgi:hypothetical protein
MQVKKSLRTKVHEFLYGENGTVESALVLIPTVLLFLSVLQIAASVLGRGVAVNNLQGDISREALLGSTALGESSDLAGTLINRLPLPGGGSIIIGKRKSVLPKISPLVLANDSFNSTGIAIDEN